MGKEIKSIWIGPEFISLGFSYVEDGMIYHKDIGPFSRSRQIMVEPLNIDNEWEERKELVKSGARKDPIRIYWMDILGKPYKRGLNIIEKSDLKTLKVENEQLRNYVEELHGLIEAESHPDRLRRKVKDYHDFYVDKLKPAFRPTNLEGQQ